MGVDWVGGGAGTVNELTRLGHTVKKLGSKQRPEEGEVILLSGDDVVAGEKFNTKRSRWYWRLREDLRFGNIALPLDAELSQDLITPKWGTHNGVIWVESKEDLMERLPGGRSPNKGDSVVYGNWVRDRSSALSLLKKRTLTTAQRLQKELEDMDRNEKRAAPGHRAKYGSPLRQG